MIIDTRSRKKGLQAMHIQKNELFNSITHLIGLIGGILMTAVFFISSIDVDSFLAVAVSITGISYVFLYASSFMHHANKLSETDESLWLKLDHCAIFMMMAGSYVGPLYIFAHGGIRWGVLAAVWLFALSGMAVKLRYLVMPNWANVAIYAPLCAIAFVPMYLLWDTVNAIPERAVPITVMKMMLVAGLAMYGAGGLIYALKRPDPKPGLVGFHGIFHLFVLAGSGLHAAALYYSIVAYPVIRDYLP